MVASVPVAPAPFAGSDDKTHAVYELFLTNAGREPATISRIDVLDAASGASVATLDPADLNDQLDLANSSPADGLLGRLGALESGLTPAQAAETLAAITDVQFALMLRDKHGWPLDKIENWMRSTSSRLLLRSQ